MLQNGVISALHEYLFRVKEYRFSPCSFDPRMLESSLLLDICRVLRRAVSPGTIEQNM